MRTGDFLKRNSKASDVGQSDFNELVICDSNSIKKAIKDWTQNSGWRISEFVTFLKLIGVSTPIELIRCSQYSQYQTAIKGFILKNRKMIEISLFSGDNSEDASEISITIEGEKRRYEVNCKKDDNIPKVTLVEKQLKTEDSNEISIHYTKEFWSIKLDCHRHFGTLSICIDELQGPDKKLLLEKSEQIEKYLLTLDVSSLDVLHVYRKLTEILGFSKEDLLRCEDFHIVLQSWNSIAAKQDIRIKDGIWKRYVTCSKGKKVTVCKNGNWEYEERGGIKIKFDAEAKKHFIAVKTEEQIAELDTKLESVTSEITEIEKSLNDEFSY